MNQLRKLRKLRKCAYFYTLSISLRLIINFCAYFVTNMVLNLLQGLSQFFKYLSSFLI